MPLTIFIEPSPADELKRELEEMTDEEWERLTSDEEPPEEE